MGYDNEYEHNERSHPANVTTPALGTVVWRCDNRNEANETPVADVVESFRDRPCGLESADLKCIDNS